MQFDISKIGLGVGTTKKRRAKPSFKNNDQINLISWILR